MPRSNRWAAAGLVRSGTCTVSWRLLDAQYWGVPQRRKRIFLVADYTNGPHSEEILFKPESLSGYTTPSEKAKTKTAGGTFQSPDCTNHLLCDIAHHCDPVRIQKNTSPSLTAHMGTGGLNVPILYQKTIRALQARDYKGVGNQYVQDRKLIVEKTGHGTRGSEGVIQDENLKIRKLTPLECERLQGLPDNWTLLDNKCCLSLTYLQVSAE